MAGVISVLSSEEDSTPWEHDLSRDSSYVSARTSRSSSRYLLFHTMQLASDPISLGLRNYRWLPLHQVEVSIQSDFTLGRHIGAGEIEEIPDYLWLPFTPNRRLPAPGTAPTNNSGGLHSEAPPSGRNANRNFREWKGRERMGSLWHFSIKEIQKATYNFDENQLISWDGTGSAKLYKGRMPGFQHPVVIKVPKQDWEYEKRIINEILILSGIRHKNITKPIGVCLDEVLLYSVFEFFPNGTLEEKLYNGHMLWEMRLKVATEVAGALAYLHSSLDAPIVHGDINPSCIYLDANYTAKICDFLQARSVPSDQTHISTVVRGTAGYLDPDVFSFGVFLMLLLTRQKPLVAGFNGAYQYNVLLFISSMKGGKLEEILDVAVANANTLDEMRLVARLAAKCLERRSEDRPTMQEVSMALEQIRIAGSSSSHVDLAQRSISIDDLYSEYINSASWAGSYVNNSNTDIYSKLLRWPQNRQKKHHLLMKQFLKYRYDIENKWKGNKIYTIHEIKLATNNFDVRRIIGKGRSIIYKCLLDGTFRTIKKPTDYYSAEEILNEINFLSQLRHKNIVGLLGFCFEAEYPMTILEYMSNGPLNWKIQDKTISWESRLTISSQIAEALSYLHTSHSSPIIHGDVKSSNILLGNDNVAKISDFGLAAVFGMDDENPLPIRETPGYIDPEYLHTGRISCKSDVYGFGVVLAQLITGKEAIFRADIENAILATHFEQLVDKKLLEQYIDENIADMAFIGQIKVVANLALKCLSLTGNERPSMTDVAMKLQLLQRNTE